MSLFKGLSAFPITPSDDQGRVDVDCLALLVDRLVMPGIGSAGVLGSTGTYAYLQQSERQRAAEAAIEASGNRLPVIISVGALSTRETIALARHAAASRADGLLIAPISYTPLTDEEVYQHYLAIAKATDLPICIYNNPGTTHFQFSTKLLARLAELPTIAAVKMPLPTTDDYGAALKDLRTALPDDFTIGYSGDWGCAEGMIAGADSWFSVVAGTLPALTARLATEAKHGDAEAARSLNTKLASLWKIFQTHGSLRVVYALANHLQLTQAHPPRPILPADDQAISALIEELEQNGISLSAENTPSAT